MVIGAFTMADQGRTYNDAAIWGCSLQGRGVQRGAGREICGECHAGLPPRNAGLAQRVKEPAEARMRLNETLASGMVILLDRRVEHRAYA